MEKVEIDKDTEVLRHGSSGDVKYGIARRSANNRRDTSDREDFFKAAVKNLNRGMRRAVRGTTPSTRVVCLQDSHLHAGRTLSLSLITTPELDGHGSI